ncbi:hypothetical protein [Halococcus saccharolyticus]|uniref:Uncharacterized protein n=1 Tax=Halococcus saccharolyticus DSM 5350 TaxID=1227455 RepID=M0MQI3_9EURY|nr:hypothetical protein [Halococcus saccharolyticus]EMA47982.1 hypothetical protein C449_00880 [Halococcus saccharolyticus DSM 5350]
MVDYTVLQSGDDLYAPEHVAVLAAAAPIDEYVDFGLKVPETSIDASAGTFDLTEGKVYAILDTALAEWQADDGTSHSQTVHNALVASHYDARSGVALASTTETNHVYADLNYEINDDPLIEVTTGGSSADDAVEISRIDPQAGTAEPRNQYPSGEFSNLTVQDQFEDPSGRVHTGELAGAADIRTDDEINTAVNQNASHGSDAPHDYLQPAEAVAAVNAETSLDVSVSGEAGSVAGSNVSGAVAEADHAAAADNADAVGGIPGPNLLRTDTRDRMDADANWNGYGIDNISKLTPNAAADKLLDLRSVPNGRKTVVVDNNEDNGQTYEWRSRADMGRPLAIARTDLAETQTLLSVEVGGNVHADEGHVFSEEGRLASQTWTNQNMVNAKGDSMTGPLDMEGNPFTGVGGLQAAGDTIDIRDDVTMHRNGLGHVGHISGAYTITAGVDAPEGPIQSDVPGFGTDGHNVHLEGPRPNLVMNDSSSGTPRGNEIEIVNQEGRVSIQNKAQTIGFTINMQTGRFFAFDGDQESTLANFS